MEVRRMRSSFTLQRGEFRGCVGCHETRTISAGKGIQYPSELLSKGPQTPEPPSWGDRTILDYRQHIQPIFDQHCVECHGVEQPKAGLDLSSREIGGFAQSYRSIMGLKPEDPTPIMDIDIHLALHPDAAGDVYKSGRKMAKRTIERKFQQNEWPGMLVSISDRLSDASITQPYQFGSTKSKLTRMLLDDEMHRNKVRSQMSEDEWLRLVTWIDYNALYHSTVIDKSRFKSEGVLTRVPFLLPDPWQPADVHPSFLNEAHIGDPVYAEVDVEVIHSER
jgi:hypothetical protein